MFTLQSFLFLWPWGVKRLSHIPLWACQEAAPAREPRSLHIKSTWTLVTLKTRGNWQLSLHIDKSKPLYETDLGGNPLRSWLRMLTFWKVPLHLRLECGLQINNANTALEDGVSLRWNMCSVTWDPGTLNLSTKNQTVMINRTQLLCGWNFLY